MLPGGSAATISRSTLVTPAPPWLSRNTYWMYWVPVSRGAVAAGVNRMKVKDWSTESWMTWLVKAIVPTRRSSRMISGRTAAVPNLAEPTWA